MQAITKVFSDIVKPYIDTVKQVLTDQVNNDGCKNHFGMSLSNSVDNGITYQVNENNTITANGTVTASPSAVVGTSGYITGLIVGETYVLSGLPESTTVSGGEAFIKLYKNDNSYSEIKTSSGSKTLTFTYDGTNARAIDVGIRTVGAVVTNAVFKPMICLKSLYDADTTYVPYAKTSQQLTKETTGLIDNQNVNGAVNMAPNDMVTQVASGVTFTVNSDKTITQVGNVTATKDIVLGTTTLPKGTYTLSDGIHDTHSVDSSQKYTVFVAKTNPWSWIARSDGRDTLEQTFTLNTDTEVTIVLRVYPGYGDGNTYKPMITVASYNGPYVPYAKSNKELTEIVDPMKTQFDADHNIVNTVSNVMNTYFTDNAMPSDWSNLTTQQATDIAQTIYDVFKKIGGAAWKRHTGIMRWTYRKASDGSELASSVLMVDLYSNTSYNSMLSNNASARFTLTMCPYGETLRITLSLWGNKLMYSSHGINNAGTVFDFDKLYTYNTISTYKG